MKKTVYLTSKQDGLKLHVLLMEPEEEPKGIVQIVHGMAEHKVEKQSLKMYIRSLNGQKIDMEKCHIIYLDTAWDH